MEVPVMAAPTVVARWDKQQAVVGRLHRPLGAS